MASPFTIERPSQGTPARPLPTAPLNPELPCPGGLTSWNGSDPELRFAVCRNNVMVSLIDALADTFPVVQALVGEEFFFGPWRGCLRKRTRRARA